MSWRVPSHGKAWEACKGEKNRRSLKRLVDAGEVHAVIAIARRQPIGWCCFGPRESFPRIARMRALNRDVSPGTWSVVCFYIPSSWRRKGLGTALLQAATDRALALGANEVEGFPAVPWRADEAVPGAFAWTGVRELFETVGYRRLERDDVKRPIYLRLADAEE